MSQQQIAPDVLVEAFLQAATAARVPVVVLYPSDPQHMRFVTNRAREAAGVTVQTLLHPELTPRLIAETLYLNSADVVPPWENADEETHKIFEALGQLAYKAVEAYVERLFSKATTQTPLAIIPATSPPEEP